MAHGINGNWRNFKDTSKSFKDKNGNYQERRQEGTFGSDKSVSSSFGNIFTRHEFDMKFGEYEIGKFKFDFGQNGLSAELKLGSKSDPIKVDKPLVQFVAEDGFSKDLYDNMKTALNYIGCEKALDKIKIREYSVEKPSATVGLGMSTESIGGKASADIGAIRLVLETPVGNVSLKFKRGIGVGAMYGQTATKKGDKTGVKRELNVSLGSWEILYTPLEEGVSPEKLIPKAQTKAKEVVNKLATDYTEVHSIKNDFNKLSDAIVSNVAETLAPSANVNELVKEYENSPDKLKALVEFEKKIKIIDSISFDDMIEIGLSTSCFLSEVAILTKNRDLANTAIALKGVTQFFSGFQQLSSSINAMSAVGSSFNAASISSILGPAGLVLGGISILSSLFGGGDDGLGEALEAIHSAIMGMWSEMRESFQLTWQLLEQIDGKLNQMNQRLEIIMNAIQYSYEELSSQIESSTANISGQLIELRAIITSYLEHLSNQDAEAVIRQISITPIHEIPDKLSLWIATLQVWLTQTATLDATTGKVEVLHGSLSVNTNELLKQITAAVSKERREKWDIPLGLYYSIAKDIQPDFMKGSSIRLINPKNWFRVLDIYMRVLRLASATILKYDENTVLQYVKQIEEVQLIAVNVKEFFVSLSSSHLLWNKLIADYQNYFDELKMFIENFQPLPVAEGLDFPYNWNYLKDATANIQLMTADGNIVSHGKTVVSKLNWVGIKGVRDREKVPIDPGEYIGDINRDVPAGDLHFSLTETQSNILMSRKEVQNKLNQISYQISYDIRLAVALAYGVAKPAFAYEMYNVGSDNFNWDFSLYIAPGVIVDGNILPLFRGSLFRHLRYHKERGWGGWGEDINLFALTDSNSGNGYKWNFRFKHRSDFDNFNLDSFIDKFISAKVKNVFSEKLKSKSKVDIEETIKTLRLSYLKIVFFIQLLDPSFSLNLSPSIFDELSNSLYNLISNGTPDDLSKVHEIISGKVRNKAEGNLQSKVWQEELWTYMGDNLISFSKLALISKLQKALIDYPMVKKAEKAIQDLGALRNDFDVSKSVHNFESKLNDLENQMSLQINILDESVLVFNQIISMTATIESINNNFLKLLIDFNQFILRRNSLSNVEKLKFAIYEEDSNNNTGESEFSINEAIDSSLTTSKLLSLCSNPKSTIMEIKSELLVLDKSGDINRINEGTDEVRPLRISIAYKRPEIVKLLLEFDAKIFPSDSTFIDEQLNDKESFQIKALLRFYSHMQSLELGEPFKVGKALSLIRESMDALEMFQKLEDVVMMIGKTGGGKSTIINVLSGVEYDVCEDKYGEKYLQSLSEEKTKSSNSSSSETAYPIIIKDEKTGKSLVDLPGILDTRGVAYEMAAGIGAQLLPFHISSFKVITLVCKWEHISVKGKDVLDNFNMLGRLVNSSPELMKNVLLIVNKANKKLTPDIVVEKIQEILKENSQLDGNTRFVMQNLVSDKIISTEVPDQKFRTEFEARLARVTSIDSNAFHFHQFNKHGEKFIKLLEQLQNYHRDMSIEVESGKSFLFSESRQMLELTSKEIFKIQISSNLKTISLSDELTSKRDLLLNNIMEQNKLVDDLKINLINPLLTELSNRLLVDGTFVTKEDPVKVLRQLIENVAVSGDFFDRMKDIQLRLNEVNSMYEIPVDNEGNQDASSSWPLPGAAAVYIGGRSNFQTSLLSYEVMLITMLKILMSKHFLPVPPDTVPSMPNTDLKVPFTRSFSGENLLACRYNWTGVLRFLLPQTTIISDGSHEIFGNMPIPICNEQKLEFRFGRDCSIRINGQTVSLLIGNEDSSLLIHYGDVMARSFLRSLVMTFTEVIVKRKGSKNQLINFWIVEVVHIGLLYILFPFSSLVLHVGLFLFHLLGNVTSEMFSYTISIFINFVLIINNCYSLGLVSLIIQLMSATLATTLGEIIGSFIANILTSKSFKVLNRLQVLKG